MTLSIVAAFCDKDYKLIPNLLINIEEKVHIPHEIILIDNREEFKDDPVNFTPATVYSKGCNAYQFEARRFAVQFCKGDYIWYIDSDDEICTVKEDLNFTEDVIMFNYGIFINVITLPYTWQIVKEVFKRKRFTSINKSEFKNYCITDNPWDICCCTLWNKWIKRSLMEDIIKDIPENLIIVASEDILYASLAIDRCNTMCFCDDSIYIYHEGNAKGLSANMSTERFFHIIKGRKQSRELFEKLTSQAPWYDDIQTSVAYFYTKLIYTDDPDSCFREMLNHFSKEELIDGFSHYWLDDLKPEHQETLKKAAKNVINYDVSFGDNNTQEVQNGNLCRMHLHR